jgi:hypothetical protein
VTRDEELAAANRDVLIARSEVEQLEDMLRRSRKRLEDAKREITRIARLALYDS